MPDPVVALTTFALLALVLAAFVWPDRGVVPRLLRLTRLSERVRLEDALKHVYTCERMGQPCTLESVAGRLQISTGRAAALVSQLASMRLVRTTEEGPRLTTEGEQTALRIVRTHRLWERFLADRTGVPAGEWHGEAERMEHALTPEETEALAARLGHPRWDPHGDPIPSQEGEVPPRRGVALSSATPGTSVEVLHLEDEPREIYESLVADGLAPGVRMDVLARDDRSVRVRGEGREWSIDIVVAGNLTVRALPAGERARGPRRTLADAVRGEVVRVVGLSLACQGIQRRRLLDLGVVKGTTIIPQLTSAAGDPVAYEIRGALVALRKEQASWILVEAPDEAPAQAVS